MNIYLNWKTEKNIRLCAGNVLGTDLREAGGIWHHDAPSMSSIAWARVTEAGAMVVSSLKVKWDSGDTEC